MIKTLIQILQQPQNYIGKKLTPGDNFDPSQTNFLVFTTKVLYQIKGDNKIYTDRWDLSDIQNFVINFNDLEEKEKFQIYDMIRKSIQGLIDKPESERQNHTEKVLFALILRIIEENIKKYLADGKIIKKIIIQFHSIRTVCAFCEIYLYTQIEELRVQYAYKGIDFSVEINSSMASKFPKASSAKDDQFSFLKIDSKLKRIFDINLLQDALTLKTEPFRGPILMSITNSVSKNSKDTISEIKEALKSLKNL